MKNCKIVICFIVCTCLLVGCGSKELEPVDMDEVSPSFMIEGGGISRFTKNENATPLTENKYIEILKESSGENYNIVITDSNHESISLNRDIIDIIEFGNFKACYYGTQFMGTQTPTDYYIVDISNADADDILIIENAHGAEINTVEDCYVYAEEAKDIIYTAADDTLVLDE